MSGIKVSSKLPEDDSNGLVVVMSEMVREAAPEIYVAVTLIDCTQFVFHKDTAERVPTARIRRIEVILDPGDREVVRRILERALEKRTGRETLPLDLERELDEAFGSKDVTDYQEDPGSS